jgi:hypothetical protein
LKARELRVVSYKLSTPDSQLILTFLVVISRGSHPFPSRTRKLSPAEPMILHG